MSCFVRSPLSTEKMGRTKAQAMLPSDNNNPISGNGSLWIIPRKSNVGCRSSWRLIKKEQAKKEQAKRELRVALQKLEHQLLVALERRPSSAPGPS